MNVMLIAEIHQFVLGEVRMQLNLMHCRNNLGSLKQSLKLILRKVAYTNGTYTRSNQLFHCLCMHMNFFQAYVIKIAQYGIIHMPLHIRLSHNTNLQHTYHSNQYHRAQCDGLCLVESSVVMAERHLANA